jgi:hypothetical protein
MQTDWLGIFSVAIAASFLAKIFKIFEASIQVVLGMNTVGCWASIHEQSLDFSRGGIHK